MVTTRESKMGGQFDHAQFKAEPDVHCRFFGLGWIFFSRSLFLIGFIQRLNYPIDVVTILLVIFRTKLTAKEQGVRPPPL